MKTYYYIGFLFFIFCTSCATTKTIWVNNITPNSQYSIPIKFDLIRDENITLDDPRLKSLIFASHKNSILVITYTNPNAKNLADKIAFVLSKENLTIESPQLITPDHNIQLDNSKTINNENNLKEWNQPDKYVVVQIKYY